MATTTTKPDIETSENLGGIGVSGWPSGNAASEFSKNNSGQSASQKPSHGDALQALLAFSALHEQVRRRKALAARHGGFDTNTPAEFEPSELFVLDEVLQLVAERAIAITGADGLAIALAENNEIVLRAAAGTVRPDVGARIDRDSAFSGACFRTALVVNCDDTELDPRVNLEACRKLGARSMVAVPLCGRRRVIGVLEAFSAWPFGFNDSDVRNLTLLAELVLAALKPEDEDRFAESAQVAATKLEPSSKAPAAPIAKSALPAQPAALPTPAASAAAMPPMPAVRGSQPSSSGDSRPRLSTERSAPLVAPVEKAVEKSEAKNPLKIEPKAPGQVEPRPVAKVESKAAAQVEPNLSRAASQEKTEPKAAEIPAANAAAPVAHEKTAEPALTFGQLESEPGSRRWIPIVLVSIVIAAAAAAGIWWKVKTAQLGSAIVHTEETPVKPAAPEPAQNAPATSDANPEPAASSDASSDTTTLQTPPATPQELARFPRVTGVRHWSSADTSTVVLDLEDQVQYEPGHLSNPDRVYFDLRDTQLVSELQGKSFDGDALLSRIRVAQPVAGVTRIVLEAKGGATLSQPQVSLERDPYRLMIKVTKAGVTPKAVNLFPNAPETAKKKLAIMLPPPTKEDLQLRARVPKMRVVVDAGHGGWDLGTVGRRGLLEKDLVFEISQRLGKLLQSRLGFDVIYTRPDDNYVTLDERAEIANQAQADLFISVHANYSDLPSARGVETYYTNFFSAPGFNPANAKDLPPSVADKRSVAGSLTNAVTPTLSPADLHDRIEQSRRLAASVQRSLYGMLSLQNPGLRDRGVKEAGFVVLTESAMPGILAEVSFVSSPADEQKLRSDGYREQIAEALYKGIARYAATSRGVKVASAK